MNQRMTRLSNRISELRELKDGWLDGEGMAPSGDGLSWLFELVGKLITFHQAPCPYIYPTPDGGVSLEWDIGGDKEFTIDVNLATHAGVIADGDDEKFATLSDNGNMQWIANRLAKLSEPPCKPDCAYYKAQAPMGMQRNALRA